MNKKSRIALRIVILSLVLVLAGISIPGFYSRTGVTPKCVRSLRHIQLAKVQWMNDNDKTLEDVPTWDDIKPYIAGYAEMDGYKDGLPVCPKAGAYSLGKVGELARCSVGGKEHSLPPNSFAPYRR